MNEFFAPKGPLGKDHQAIVQALLANETKFLQELTAAEGSKPFSIGAFEKFAFPIIRRTSPALIANNIVSVQPMTGPVGGVAFYRPRYGTNHQSDADKTPPLRVGDTVRRIQVRTRQEFTVFAGTIVLIEERHAKGQPTKTLHAIVESIHGDERIVLPIEEFERVNLLDALAESIAEPVAQQV